jgi:23S rRNA pseudouridine2605 synthase
VALLLSSSFFLLSSITITLQDMLVRLQKILSTAGVASRRAAERLMVEGRVSVNGVTVRDLGSKADPEQDDIRLDGRRVGARPSRRYLLVNKPRGVVTTRSDPQKRPTVLSLLPNSREYVYPVGRLDYESEGILVLTNDGELAARLTHPRHEVERVYIALVSGVPDARALQRLERGVPLDGRRTAPAHVSLRREIRIGGRERAVLELTLKEGRNRQVRRMCEAIGHPVLELRRTRFGPLTDAGLRPGMVRELTSREIHALRRAAGLFGGDVEPPVSSRRRPAPPGTKIGSGSTLRRVSQRDRPRRA